MARYIIIFILSLFCIVVCIQNRDNDYRIKTMEIVTEYVEDRLSEQYKFNQKLLDALRKNGTLKKYTPNVDKNRGYSEALALWHSSRTK